MRRAKVLLSSIGLGLLAIAIIFLISNFVGNDEFQLDSENISIFEEDNSVYYLKKASKDLGFKIVLAGSTDKLEYKLTDEAGNEVDARIKQKSDGLYEIRAPKSGYEEGKRYRLELGQGASFSNEDLSEAQSLVFAIERGPIEHYKFTDQVIELDQEILEVESDRIEVEGYDLTEDDIVFGLNETEEYVAYKVTEVLNDGSAQVTIPAIDEIYSELEVYGDYEFDFTEIITNPEIEAKLISNIENSDFFDFLISSAYAENKDLGEVDIELEYQPNEKNNGVQFKVIITLKAGDDGLFGKKSLKHHEVKLTLISELGTTANIDIDSVKNWDVSANRSEGFAWALDISYKPPKIDESTKLSELFKEDNEEDVLEITRLLNEMVSDELKNEITLFEQGIPISGVPGLILTLEVNIVVGFELQANLNFNNDYSTVTTVGLMFRDGEFNPYYHNEFETSGGGASIKGKVKSKAGINFEVKTKLFHDNVAYMSLKPEVGLYADAYVAVTMKSAKLDKDNTYGYFESGTYFNAAVKGQVNLLIKKYELSKEIDEIRKRFDQLSFGDYKIVAGLDTEKPTLYAKDFLVDPANFTFDYYDIRSEKEVNQELDAGELSYFLEDGKELKFKDGKIVLPKTDKEELIVRATYQDKESRKAYHFDLAIYISENRPGGFIDHEGFEEPMMMMFSSGAGAWRTVIELHRDGSFTGVYSDSNAGMFGDGYLATVIISEFSGQFDEIEKIDEDTYSMKLVELNYEYEKDEEWIEDEVKYIAADAYGLSGGDDFLLYSPHKNKDDFTMDFLSWGAYSQNPENKLGHWALHDVKTDYGFFSEDYYKESEEENDSQETATNPKDEMLTSFDDIVFQNTYDGPGSEFIGTWRPVYDAPIDFAILSWEVNYKDGTFYISADMPGDPKVLLMTAKYKDGKLHSENGTQINLMDYDNPEKQRIELPETVEAGNEVSEFFFEDGYLMWVSEERGNLADFLPPDADFKGYEKE